MSVNLQQKIRQNAQEMQDYLKDLYKWEEKVNKTEPKALPNKNTNTCPIRSTAENKSQSTNNTNFLKRDQNSVQNYYKAWDKFDVVY